jgi:hypothetical protein
MAGKSRLTRLDAFSKTVEDARVRTTSGGIVTLASVLVVLFLIVGEIRDYRHTTIHAELVVDKSRGDVSPACGGEGRGRNALLTFSPSCL